MDILIDHRRCGGSGCRGCKGAGTMLVKPQMADGPMPADEAAFEVEREACPCYEGFSINAGVSQCTHAGRRDSGERCDVESCPRVALAEATEGPAP